MGKQRLDRPRLFVVRSNKVQRRAPFPVGDAGIGFCPQQQPYGGDGPAQKRGGTGQVQRRVAVPVLQVGIATGIQQRLHRLGRADLGRAVHRRAAVAAGRVGIGALRQQGPHLARIALRLTGKLAKARVVVGLGMSEDGAEHEHEDARKDQRRHGTGLRHGSWPFLIMECVSRRTSGA